MEVAAESYRIALACEFAFVLLSGILQGGFTSRRRSFRMSSMMLLVGAVFASLAFGVLMAYALCLGMFRIFRVHAQSAARRSQTASISASAGS
jgi:uncharacterized membrane protein